MTPRFGYVLVVLPVIAILPGGGAVAAAAGATTERPLAAIVASGPGATSAALADGSWNVELGFLVSDRDGNGRCTSPMHAPARCAGRPATVDRTVALRRRREAAGSCGRAGRRGMRTSASREPTAAAGSCSSAGAATTPSRTGRRTAHGSRSPRIAADGVSCGSCRPPAGLAAQLAETPGRESAPAWPPGGARLAFARESAGDADLWVLELADGSTRKLTRSAAWDSTPDCSPRGGRIAFARARADRTSLWTVGADGSPAHPVEGTPVSPIRAGR
jgi:hypothetical protein